ncbi:MAG: ABC transporter ATP-binding protein [Propioniciclava sp.]
MSWQAEQVSFSYGRQVVLDRVSITIAPGQVVGLLGPSGQGKSTLGKIMAGWISRFRGQVLLDGHTLPRAAGRPHPVQYLNQNPETAVNPRWRMKQVLNEGWAPDQQTIEHLGVEPAWLSRFPAEISGGEMQRFCIARALHPGLKYLVADEMTTMVDPITQAEIWGRLSSIARQRQIGVMLITHNPALVRRLCDEAYELKELEAGQR